MVPKPEPSCPQAPASCPPSRPSLHLQREMGTRDEGSRAVAHVCVTVVSKANTATGQGSRCVSNAVRHGNGTDSRQGLPREAGKEVSRLPTLGGPGSETF